jgi:hypothetical protein
MALCRKTGLVSAVAGVCRAGRRLSVRGVSDKTGNQAAKRQGGDRRSERIEAYRGAILGATEEKVDLTLTEITEMLRLA